MNMKQTSIKIFPPTIFYTLAIAIIFLWVLIPKPKLFTFPLCLIGLIPLILGISLNIWTDICFKKYQTTVKPDEIPSTLLVTGPFRVSRHPMYLGMELSLMGIAIFLGSLSTFLIPVIFIVIVEKMFIPFEEMTLLTRFPKGYIQYKKQVRRWM